MNKLKIIKLSIIGLIGVNLFLFLSGIAIPWAISTNKLPLSLICIILTTIIFVIVTAICFIVNKEKSP